MRRRSSRTTPPIPITQLHQGIKFSVEHRKTQCVAHEALRCEMSRYQARQISTDRWPSCAIHDRDASADRMALKSTLQKLSATRDCGGGRTSWGQRLIMMEWLLESTDSRWSMNSTRNDRDDITCLKFLSWDANILVGLQTCYWRVTSVINLRT